MSSPRNEYPYAIEFSGNMGGKSVAVPVRVITRVRITTEETAREVHKYSCPGVPRYSIGCGGDLPIHPSLQAMGRHYFQW